mmetsp:Transcript_39316/g.76328  ORF Transcript_39316/g.76328 Transcript_39316/m.76328 type:complete len:438 (-) Transcript_39316:37-1350(-)
MTWRIVSLTLRSTLGAAATLLAAAYSLSPCNDKEKRMIHRLSIIVSLLSFIAAVVELSGGPWRGSITIITFQAIILVIEISYAACILWKDIAATIHSISGGAEKDSPTFVYRKQSCILSVPTIAYGVLMIVLLIVLLILDSLLIAALQCIISAITVLSIAMCSSWYLRRLVVALERILKGYQAASGSREAASATASRYQKVKTRTSRSMFVILTAGLSTAGVLLGLSMWMLTAFSAKYTEFHDSYKGPTFTVIDVCVYAPLVATGMLLYVSAVPLKVWPTIKDTWTECCQAFDARNRAVRIQAVGNNPKKNRPRLMLSISSRSPSEYGRRSDWQATPGSPMMIAARARALKNNGLLKPSGDGIHGVSGREAGGQDTKMEAESKASQAEASRRNVYVDSGDESERPDLMSISEGVPEVKDEALKSTMEKLIAGTVMHV